MSLCLLTGTRAARAEDAANAPVSAEPARARSRVVLLGEHDAQANAAFAAIPSALAELDVEVVEAERPRASDVRTSVTLARELARADRAQAVFWVDFQAHDALVYLYEPAAAKLFMRRIAVSDSAAAASEEIAVVLRSALSALVEGEAPLMTEIALPSPAPTQPASTPSAPAAPIPTNKPKANTERHALAELSLAYLLTRLSRDVSLQSGARIAGSAVLFDARLRLGMAFDVAPVFSVGSDGTEAQIQRTPVEAWAGFEFGTGQFRLRPEVSFLAEVVRRSTSNVALPLVSTSESTRVLLGLGARLRGAAMLTSKLRVFCAADADLVLNPFDEVVLTTNGPKKIFSFSMLRPAAEAGAAIDIW